MARRNGKTKKITKGMSSAVLLSIAIHTVLFFLAGMLVVFTVVKKKEIEFEPPKAVERPKMKLKKPKPRIKKSARPKKAQHILAKVKPANMPEIQLPELSGMGGDGMGEGIVGGFDILPDLSDASVFGSGQSIGNDFVGTYYDFTRDRSGRNIPMSIEKLRDVLKKFVDSGCKPSKLGRYYRLPQKLYATSIAIPQALSWTASEAFGGKVGQNYCYALHYKGDLVYPEDIKFRFWGLGADGIIVMVDGEPVLNAGYPRPGGGSDTSPITPGWQSNSPDSRKYWQGNQLSVVGDWIELKAGEVRNMDVLIVDSRGNKLMGVLCVQVEGVEYEREPERGGPILPLFKTSPLTLDQIEVIHAGLNPHDGCATNGLVFCDFPVPERTEPYYDTSEAKCPPPPLFDKRDYQDSRTWTALDGRSLEAGFMALVAGKAVLKKEGGRQLRIPVEELSEEDRIWLELAKPPHFNINFFKKGDSIPYPKLSPYGQPYPLKMADYVFGAELKQDSAGDYSHELTVEYFVIGEEVDGDNYVLLDRRKSAFVSFRENGKSHSFESAKPINVRSWATGGHSPWHGVKYGGYLITITDQNGKIIQYKTPYGDWLINNLENLKGVPVGRHFDKRCVRVGPPRPTKKDRPPSV